MKRSSNITIGLLAAIPADLYYSWACILPEPPFGQNIRNVNITRRCYSCLPPRVGCWRRRPTITRSSSRDRDGIHGFLFMRWRSFGPRRISRSVYAPYIGIAVINATGNIALGALSPFMIGWLKDITGSFNSDSGFVASVSRRRRH